MAQVNSVVVVTYGSVSCDPYVLDRDGSRVPPRHHICFGQITEEALVVVETMTRRDSHRSPFERHSGRVEDHRPWPIEKEIAIHMGTLRDAPISAHMRAQIEPILPDMGGTDCVQRPQCVPCGVAIREEVI